MLKRVKENKTRGGGRSRKQFEGGGVDKMHGGGGL